MRPEGTSGQSGGRIAHLVISADIAVGVLLNSDGSDAEFLPLQPLPYPNSTIRALEAQWSARHLHFAGVLGWHDGAIHAELEPLPQSTLERVHAGFEAYLEAFSADPKAS